MRSTIQVILSDTETTTRGVLCLAPIGRLACTTTRSSRSFCCALRSIRQSNNVNESCTEDDPDEPIRAILEVRLAGRNGTRFRPGCQQPIYRMVLSCGKGLFTSFQITPPPLGACRLGSTCQRS